MKDIHVACLMCTCGRNLNARRALTFFLKQNYSGSHTLLIYNNSDQPTNLIFNKYELPANKSVMLINNHISKETGEPYKNLREIYDDAMSELTLIKPDLLNIYNDDDMYLPNHISEGVNGYLRANANGQIAYKPKQSYVLDYNKSIYLNENVHEQSIFVEFKHVLKYGFYDDVSQHMKWILPLNDNNKILIDPSGLPTYIYVWNQDIPTYKISGRHDDKTTTFEENFKAYRRFSNDHNSVLRPLSQEEMSKWLDFGWYFPTNDLPY